MNDKSSYIEVSSIRKPTHNFEVANEALAFSKIFGIDGNKVGNLHLIEDEVMMYISANSIVVDNFGLLKSQKYIPSIDEGGIGSLAIHPSRYVKNACMIYLEL